jgi:hypothetical protein
VLNKTPKPGDQVQVALAGLASGQPLYLYRYTQLADGRKRFVAFWQLPAATLDSHGEALYPIQMLPADRQTCYVIDTGEGGRVRSFADPRLFELAVTPNFHCIP